MKKRSPIITVALLIAGNLVGAGILALPINTGPAGFIPAMVSMVLVGSAMYVTALILSHEAIRTQESTFNYPSLYHNYLGAFGKWIGIAANLLILYGLLVAYLSGASTIIAHLIPYDIPRPLITIGFFLVITGLNLTEMEYIRRHNALLMVFLWASFALIVFLGEQHVEPVRLLRMNWTWIPMTVPIVITAFHFHNIIPHVCESLHWNRRTIALTMAFGMIVGFIMNAIWIQVGIGVLPLTGETASILGSLTSNLPATIPMARIIQSPLFTTGALLFALLAIATSYLANGTGLLGFIEDLTKNHLKRHTKSLEILLTFGPPLAITLLYPDAFLKALNIVGGVGIVLLFGLLPGVIALKWARGFFGHAIGVVLLLLFGSFLIVEIAQEAGFLTIDPQIEHWNTIYLQFKANVRGLLP